MSMKGGLLLLVISSEMLGRGNTLTGYGAAPCCAVPCEQLWPAIARDATRDMTRLRLLLGNCSNAQCVCEKITMTESGMKWPVQNTQCASGLPNVGTGPGWPNLHGVELLINTNPWPPFIDIEEDAFGKRTPVGFSIDLLNELSKLLNFSYTLNAEAGDWGAAESDGNWTGMVGRLQRREIDMVIGALGFRVERLAVMDFSMPFDDLEMAMWVQNSGFKSRVWMAFFDMLDVTVTCLLLAGIVLFAGLLTASSKLREADRSYTERGLKSVLTDRAFFLMGALLGQGLWKQPVTVTAKTLVATWWLFSVVFSITYSATLIASLSANSTQLPFTSAEGLYQQYEYKYGLLGESSEHMFLEPKGKYTNTTENGHNDMHRKRCNRQQNREQITNDSAHKKLWGAISEWSSTDADVLSTDYKVHVQRVVNEKYVFIGVELPWAKSSGQQVHVVKVGQPFFNKDICLGLQLNSPYTKAMSQGVKVLRELGITTWLKKRWWRPNRHMDVEMLEFQAIPISRLAGVFFTVGVGLVASVLCLVAELVFHRATSGPASTTGKTSSTCSIKSAESS